LLIVYKDIAAYCNPCARVFFLHSNKRELIHHHPLLYFSYGIRAGVSISTNLPLSTMNTLSLNAENFVTLKLSPTNYSLWREQALALAENKDLVGHLTNEEPAPTQYISPTPNTINISDIKHSELELTEDFVPWQKSDRLLRGWIIGTLSEEALGLVVFFFFFSSSSWFTAPPIIVTGDSAIKPKKKKVELPLKDVLYVPDPTKKLLFASQSAKQLPINCEFSNVSDIQ
jgi:hypothetical protein